ncbi:MAG TPA: tetratricopeptide repeat protein, partial [Streptosporangiaceae bacterium]|nr:tetratricopeptide repeat protein [Streptosporangiaceae bacterium]
DTAGAGTDTAHSHSHSHADAGASAARAGADPDAFGEVVRLCAGLPLAVCVAGALLAAGPRWPIKELATELAGQQRRLAALGVAEDIPVRAALDVSYQALPPAAARLYRLLALVPGPSFCPSLAAAATAVDATHAHELLGTLTGASLLAQVGEGRFRFHDLVRLHAREQALLEPPGEQHAGVARSVAWYLRAAVAADLVVIPGRWRLGPLYDQAALAPSASASPASKPPASKPSAAAPTAAAPPASTPSASARPAYGGPAEALDWAESALPGLLAAVRAAYDEGLHEQAWQLCEAMWGLFTHRKHYEQWISAHELGVAAATACGDQRAQARMRVQLGLAYLELGEHAQARTQFTRALELDRRAEHRLGEATALAQLGRADEATGRTGAAIAAFSQARDIFDELGAPDAADVRRRLRALGAGSPDSQRGGAAQAT